MVLIFMSLRRSKTDVSWPSMITLAHSGTVYWCILLLASRMVERLHKVGLEQAAVIGEVVEDPKGKIVVEAA